MLLFDISDNPCSQTGKQLGACSNRRTQCLGGQGADTPWLQLLVQAVRSRSCPCLVEVGGPAAELQQATALICKPLTALKAHVGYSRSGRCATFSTSSTDFAVSLGFALTQSCVCAADV